MNCRFRLSNSKAVLLLPSVVLLIGSARKGELELTDPKYYNKCAPNNLIWNHSRI